MHLSRAAIWRQFWNQNKRSKIVFAVTSVALSLGHLAPRLLELPAHSLIGSPSTLVVRDVTRERRLQTPQSLDYTHLYSRNSDKHFLSEYRDLLSEYRALLSEYRALLSEYRALLSEHRSLLCEYGSLWSGYRANLFEYRALLFEYGALSLECMAISEYRALLSEYRHTSILSTLNPEP